eukprot:m.119347 g.119347  ORF g.119347 m.119347 type:complete len:496 (-) comp13291_c0_seq1:2369-3856(-)
MLWPIVTLVAVICVRPGSGSSAGLILTPCSGNIPEQAFGLKAEVVRNINGSTLFSGRWCIDIQDFQTSKGSTVYAWPCGSGSAGTNELWAIEHNLSTQASTITSRQPNTPFCLGASAASGATLEACSSPAAQFKVGLTATTPGTIVHEQSGLCLTVAAPPNCTTLPPTPAPGPIPHGAAPCDIYASGGTPCVAAHSIVRALYGDFNGPLYEVMRTEDNSTRVIGVLSRGGYANASAQDEFCPSYNCVVTRFFDQSPYGNHLDIFHQGWNGHAGTDRGVNPSVDPHTINGHKVYSAYFNPGNGYRNDNTTGVAVGQQSESMYMVTSGTHYDDHCCFDYGNAETDAKDDGAGTMEAIYFGNSTKWWKNKPKNTTGPWVCADLEQGMYPGDDFINPDTIPTMNTQYVTAMLKGRVCEMTLQGGDAQQGALTRLYRGRRPEHDSYNPMRLQGALILGTGGDNSVGGSGVFFEGAVTIGYTSDATDAAVQANIVAAGYGK